MKNDLSFLEKDDDAVEKEDLLTQVSRLAHKLIDIRKDIAEMENKEKELGKIERQLAQEEIPDLLLSQRITSITLETGEKISIEDDLRASIPKEDLMKRKIAFKWLQENGGLGMIKEELVIEEPEKIIIDFLKENSIPFEQTKNVHSSTLKSFFKHKLGMTKGSLQEIEISDIPGEVSIFVFKKTKIK